MIVTIIALIFTSTAAAPASHGRVLRALGQAVQGQEYAMRFADLNGDRRNEAIVYVRGRETCGSGGCNLYVLTPTAKGYRRVARTTITQLPVCRFAERHAGWFDLGIGVGGGGLKSGMVRARFDGRRYPSNPSMQPRLSRSRCAEMLLSEDSRFYRP
jgi:hypothetical protein